MRGAWSAVRPALSVCLGWLLVGSTVSAQAADPSPETPPGHAVRIDWDLGFGHESQQAPLFQVSPDSAIVYLEGVQRQGGGHWRGRVQASYETALEQGHGFALQADVQVKRSPSDPALDFYAASLQPLWHMAWGNSSVGAGLDWQTLGVAGQAFRDAVSGVAHWTRPVDGGLWALIGQAGRSSHHDGFADLDADTASAVLQRRWDDPVPGVSAFALSGLLARETNRRDLPELSHRSQLISASLDGECRGLDWTLRLSRLDARFDAAAFASEGVRRDRTRMMDAIVQWPVTADDVVRLELNLMDNRSTIHLYDSRYRQWSLSWSRRLL
jgi:hypothetical protein